MFIPVTTAWLTLPTAGHERFRTPHDQIDLSRFLGRHPAAGYRSDECQHAPETRYTPRYEAMGTRMRKDAFISPQAILGVQAVIACHLRLTPVDATNKGVTDSRAGKKRSGIYGIAAEYI